MHRTTILSFQNINKKPVNEILGYVRISNEDIFPQSISNSLLVY